MAGRTEDRSKSVALRKARSRKVSAKGNGFGLDFDDIMESTLSQCKDSQELISHRSESPHASAPEITVDAVVKSMISVFEAKCTDCRLWLYLSLLEISKTR